MDLGAEIKTFAQKCAVRRELGVHLNVAIQEVYRCRAAWQRAAAGQVGAAPEFDALQHAREKQAAAQHDYDDHVRVHQCLVSEKQNAAAAAE